ncbi:glycosyltransferase family 2 protein [Weeksella virosa]|uniref:glycosyltransferase family 2 protein n=1 Tax=Weeksella virosa TaxID=1014 RepID=UPI0025576C59|nr:glycosyltransferase family 2 protein [Weeksella virosa]MDK7374444.1 glycosyltransferase family 2 protein [Weeksella virosa]
MGKPLFSIIICNYNNGHYFNKCFETLINQKFTEFEVIIVDDKSSDNSIEIIEDLIKNDERFKFYINEKNSGYSFTLDRGIRLANSEIIARVDPDDGITENAISEMYKILENGVYCAAYSQMYQCDEDLNVKGVVPTTRKIPVGNKNFFNIFFEVTHFFAFKKSAYLKVGGLDTTLSSSVDQDLYLKLYEYGLFKFIKKPFYYYRIHNAGISQDLNKKIKLKANRNKVLENTIKRRGFSKLYGVEVNQIDDLINFIFNKQNTIFKKLQRKIGW